MLLCLLSPSLSSSPPSDDVPAVSDDGSPSPSSSSPADGSDPQAAHEEKIESRGEAAARSMQQQYADDVSQQQREADRSHHSQAKPKQRAHARRSDLRAVDNRTAVVTGDDLRHPRDPKQQQKQQAEVRKHGEKPQPIAEQTEDRRDEESAKADQATRVAEANQPEPTTAADKHADDDAEEEEKEEEGGGEEEQEEGGDEGESTPAFHPLHDANSSRVNQTSPWHSRDPQARTWSHQQQPRLSPARSNATHHSATAGFTPGEYNKSSPLSYPLPVPTVDHAQRLMDAQAGAPAGQSGRDVVISTPSDSGSDADDEFDGTGDTDDSSSSEAEDAATTTAAAVQDPGNAVQVDDLAEGKKRSSDKERKAGDSSISEDIRDRHNGGAHLREETRGHSRRYEKGDEDEADERSDRHNGAHELDGELHHAHKSSPHSLVSLPARTASSSSTLSWLVFACVVVGALVGAGYLVRRARQQQSYEPVSSFDAYGDLVEEEQEADQVHVRVY